MNAHVPHKGAGRLVRQRATRASERDETSLLLGRMRGADRGDGYGVKKNFGVTDSTRQSK